jgi:hypothetical protein
MRILGDIRTQTMLSLPSFGKDVYRPFPSLHPDDRRSGHEPDQITDCYITRYKALRLGGALAEASVLLMNGWMLNGSPRVRYGSLCINEVPLTMIALAKQTVRIV